MDYKELKRALRTKCPVVADYVLHGEAKYNHVSAIIYRTDNNANVVVTAELTDNCNHSISIVNPERVRYKESEALEKNP